MTFHRERKRKVRSAYLSAARNLKARGVPVNESTLANELGRLSESVRAYVSHPQHARFIKRLGLKEKGHKNTVEDYKQAIETLRREGEKVTLKKIARRLHIWHSSACNFIKKHYKELAPLLD